jgi:hypothetical protein
MGGITMTHITRNQPLDEILKNPERHKNHQLKKIEARTCSPQILAEGELRAKEMGVAKAARLLGISEQVLRCHIIGKRNLEMLEKDHNVYRLLEKKKFAKYSNSQKIECVHLAFQFMDNTKLSMKKSFISAGQRLGLNGYSIMKMYQAGYIPYKREVRR